MPDKAERKSIEEQQLWWNEVQKNYPDFFRTRKPNLTLSFRIREIVETHDGSLVRLVTREVGFYTSLAIFMNHNMVEQIEIPQSVSLDEFITELSELISGFTGTENDLRDTLEGPIEDKMHDWDYMEDRIVDTVVANGVTAHIIYNLLTKQYFYREIRGLITLDVPVSSLEEAKQTLSSLREFEQVG